MRCSLCWVLAWLFCYAWSRLWRCWRMLGIFVVPILTVWAPLISRPFLILGKDPWSDSFSGRVPKKTRTLLAATGERRGRYYHQHLDAIDKTVSGLDVNSATHVHDRLASEPVPVALCVYCIYMYIYVYTCIYIFIYIYTYIYIYMHEPEFRLFRLCLNQDPTWALIQTVEALS